jgi:hypothetical protein
MVVHDKGWYFILHGYFGSLRFGFLHYLNSVKHGARI